MSTPATSAHEALLADCWAIAQASGRAPQYKKDFPTEPWRRWREPFQLFVAALISCRSAFKHQHELGSDDDVSSFHKTPTIAPVWTDTLFERSQAPYFENATDLARAFRNMHWASASFRLPLAVWLAHKLPTPISPFSGLEKQSDEWERKHIYTSDIENTINSLGCCTNGPMPGTRDGLRIALAVVMAHRDWFGHGQTPSKAMERRAKILETARVCRIAEAQLLLIHWGLKRLTDNRPT